MKRTKIVATIGPASESRAIMSAMFKAGLNVARLNFSHNKHSHHLMLINNLRLTAKKLGVSLAIIQDLQGPRIRIGEIGDGVKVKVGQEIILRHSAVKFNLGLRPVQIPVQYARLTRDVKAGDSVLIDDALIRLKVKKVAGGALICQAETAGTIKTHKGMNFPDSRLKIPPLTAKDLDDLAFGVKNKVDYVALSFVKGPRDIQGLRRKILALEKRFGFIPRLAKTPRTQIIAKIERREAIKNFSKILKTVDAVMIARGDLGIELPFEDVPLLQKKIISQCNYAGKPVIVATQMLDSMIRNPLPTRAEVSDVANAILDGTDAIMLSGESATGLYPLAAVRAMKAIADKVEPTEFKLQQELEQQLKRLKSEADCLAFNAQDLAEKTKAKIIVCLTRTGHLARLITRYKSCVPLLAVTGSEKVSNQLALSWGVSSLSLAGDVAWSILWRKIKKIVLARKLAKPGQKIVVVACCLFGYKCQRNLIKVEVI